MTILFLYGTLKRGQRNHQLLAGQHCLGPARTVPHYRLHDVGPYPGLVEDADNGRAIAGELWEVDDAALARLDQFEGAPLPGQQLANPEFTRGRVDIQGQPGPIFAYFYRRAVDRLRDCGDCWPG